MKVKIKIQNALLKNYLITIILFNLVVITQLFMIKQKFKHY